MITVVTPFKRVENKELLIELLQYKCNWVVLQEENEPVIDFPDWVKVKRYALAGKAHVSNRLFNEFISHEVRLKENLETQYMILCDDDSIEEGFFDKVPDADVVVTSMKRSDRPINHVVWRDYEKQLGRWEDSIDVLKAAPENMHIGAVGGEQIIIKGKILRNFRYGLSNVGDGRMIEQLMSENHYHITYLPDAYVLFNYFEDGRYEAFKRPQFEGRTKAVALFIGDYFCAARPIMGLSEWEGNIWSSLESTDLTDVARFHFDKFYYSTGKRGDEALLERVHDIKPDYIILIVYKHLGSDPTVMTEDTLKKLHETKIPIITIWGDLEAKEQREIALSIKPYTWNNLGTANKNAVESIGFTYTHVPKDPRIWNNPGKERDIDVLFFGSYGLGREERKEVLQYLIDNGIKLVVGGSEGRDHFSTEDYADGYKRAKIAIGFSRAHGMDVINARAFEAMSCGALLMNQDSREIEKLYESGVDFISWVDKYDLLNQIKNCLNNPDIISTIAMNGQNRTEKLYSAKSFWKEAFKK